MAQRALDSLVQFARVVSDAADQDRVFSLLCSALAEHGRADAVGVAALTEAGKLAFVATHALDEQVRDLPLEADALDELGLQVLRAAPGFHSERARPLVSGGGLFGVVVMLFRKDNPPLDEKLHLADGLVDLAALALGNAAHIRTLERQYAALQASQAMLARSEKLRALGQMAAGVSHDLRNILNPLSLHLQVVKRALDRGDVEEAKASLPEMKQVLVRGSETLDRLRAYSRQEKEPKLERVDVDELAREAARLARPRAASLTGDRAIRFREELSGPPPVTAQAPEVVSALVNLIVNAIDALVGAEKGGTITLRSGEENDGSWVDVADDGPGMPPDVARRIFEPFFTTKGTEGTGLGLANVEAAMQRMGGTITLDTKPGAGTRFRLWFPALGPPSARS